MVKTTKYEIVKPLDADWKEFGKLLNDLQYQAWKISNKTIQMMWEFDNLSLEFKSKTGLYPKKEQLNDWCGYNSDRVYIDNVIKAEFNHMNSNNRQQTIQLAIKRWKTDLKDVKLGKKSISSYKKNGPINIGAGSVKKPYKTDKGYEIGLALTSEETTAELGRKSGVFPVAIIVKDNSKKAILERLIAGEYKQSGSKLIHDSRKNKWFLLLSYSFEAGETEIDADNVMGVDCGMAIPVYMAFNNSLARYHINGGEIEKFRKGVVARRKSVLRQGKYCGDGRRGHGVKTRIKPAELLADKEKNFRDTANHKYSRFIVDMAIKHRCAVIQMEDLSGITDNANRFMKNWTYFDLQTKIEYKAEEVGIKVQKVDPSYTSQRCSECGYIDRENRQTQAEFECQSCGYKENADYNAAKNISTPDIENIIKKQLKLQGKQDHRTA